ncbi:hypothetical protein H5410_027955 [Solanum commersonii]|uniref:Uncharacterized protein n=1 Tax=Solanum commersonii TaxID=4109 RepID=A0A9J5Z3K9_SOLCO|nr:hypothetical protein H5410_027955 [Solanum commersonii]
MSVVIDKSLVFIFGGTIQMHDLIQDMDKYIVEIQNDDPGEYIRLWDAKDFEEVMVNNTVNRLNNAIIFNLWFSYTKICLSYAVKKLDLSFSDNLIRTQDFTEIPNLEYLNLIKCMDPEEVH